MRTLLQATGAIVVKWGDWYTEQRSFTWDGGPVVAMHASIIDVPNPRPGMVVAVGPYRLRLLEEDIQRGVFTAMRDGWRARLAFTAIRALRSLRLAYYAAILILNEWSLAQTDLACYPSWRDIRLVRRFMRKEAAE